MPCRIFDYQKKSTQQSSAAHFALWILSEYVTGSPQLTLWPAISLSGEETEGKSVLNKTRQDNFFSGLEYIPTHQLLPLHPCSLPTTQGVPSAFCPPRECFDSLLSTSCKTAGAGANVQAITQQFERPPDSGQPEAEIKSVTIYSPHTEPGSDSQRINIKVVIFEAQQSPPEHMTIKIRANIWL